MPIFRYATVLLLACCATYCAIAQDWSDTPRRVVLEPKDGPFEAHWISPGPELHSDAVCQGFYVRKTFNVDDPAKFRRVYVSADSRYVLWVNGKPAGRGPAVFDPQHQVYDTLDLSDAVVPGENTVAALVMYWGEKSWNNPAFQISYRPAFIFDSPGLKTDNTWKALVDPAHRAARKENRRVGTGNWFEEVDGRQLAAGFEQPGFDDSAWPAATDICKAERWYEVGDTFTPWKLYPRKIAAPEIRPAETCKPVQAGVVPGEETAPPYSLDLQAASDASAWPVTVPADGKTHYVVVDAGRLVNGFASLDVEGPAGAPIEVMYSEAPSLDGKKGLRDRLDGRRIEGSSDVYVTREGRQAYEPVLHRTFRFVRIAVRTPQPLTIHGFSFRWTGYAFPERGQFRCSDDTLNKIWNVGWYTQRMCAYDTYQDCPYYERMQYGGDTRIQLFVTYFASGDSLLPANAIRQIHASLLPEGLTQSRYPNCVFQVIPGYSLYWVQMLDDYYLHTGDAALLRECANGVESVLRFYEGYRSDKGFIGKLPYWDFCDWTYDDRGVPTASREDCTIDTIHYKATLDAAARIFDALNEPDIALRYRSRAADVVEALNKYAWSDAEGLYTDGIETKTLSQHVNAFAVIFGIADDAKKQQIAKRLFDDPKLRGTTFYFAHYLHEAAAQLGQPQRILDDMARWKTMLDMNTSTWWETPDDPRSDCHAWSSTPTYRLMSEVLGVQPTAPGFARVRIKPFPGKLEWAEGVVPTPKGDIKVHWNRMPAFTLKVEIPEGIEADVTLPNGTQKTLSAGPSTLTEQAQ
jgi:hypothetical protein